MIPYFYLNNLSGYKNIGGDMKRLVDKVKKRIQELTQELEKCFDNKANLEQQLKANDIRITQITGALHELQNLLITTQATQADQTQKD